MITDLVLASQLALTQLSVSAYQAGPAWVACPAHAVVCQLYLGYERLGKDLGETLAHTINPTVSASTSTAGPTLVW
jgi:hypothetical protein